MEKKEIKSNGFNSSPVAQFRPQVNFTKQEIDLIVSQKGYNVYLDKALKCPCRGKENGSQQSGCKNCGGSGWLFINRLKTKAILHSMNLNTKQSNWTEEKVGTVNITTSNVDRLGYMDKLTVIDAESELNQLLYPVNFAGELFAFTVYDIKHVYEVFFFVDTDTKLELLKEGVDYTFERNIIRFHDRFKYVEEPTFSVRYCHAPVFHVLDLTREILIAPIRTENGVDTVSGLPVSAVGRRAHYIPDMENYVGDRMLDNSYKSCE